MFEIQVTFFPFDLTCFKTLTNKEEHTLTHSISKMK